MDDVQPASMALVGLVAAGVLTLVLWKLFKLTLKIVVFVIAAAAIAAVVALYVTGGRPWLSTSPPPVVPVPEGPR
ncbi:MAG: hypothetical protein A2138_19425 [Deltaproteobacteria bacterium RBG_16_71_12]|nr:MAG: hypothetical protein A2138_19425 [Deltaproteobacteria bacterium RBG_16_71_12]